VTLFTGYIFTPVGGENRVPAYLHSTQKVCQISRMAEICIIYENVAKSDLKWQLIHYPIVQWESSYSKYKKTTTRDYIWFVHKWKMF